MSNASNKPADVVLRSLAAFLGTLMSRDAKRMFLVNSLVFQIVDMEMDYDDLSSIRRVTNHLNQSMDLAKYPDALLFPAYFHTLFWDESNCSSKIDPDDTLRQIKHQATVPILIDIVKKAPPWLQYGTYREMAKDVHEGIVKTMTLPTEAA